MTITLTTEQCTQLQAGKSITIEPCLPKKWEPNIEFNSGTKHTILSDGTIYPTKVYCDGNIQFGTVYDTKEQAEQVRDTMRSHNRLLKWLSENNDSWVADWNNPNKGKYYVYFDYSLKKYRFGYLSTNRSISAVYMSQANAEKLCDLLNNNLIDL